MNGKLLAAVLLTISWNGARAQSIYPLTFASPNARDLPACVTSVQGRVIATTPWWHYGVVRWSGGRSFFSLERFYARFASNHCLSDDGRTVLSPFSLVIGTTRTAIPEVFTAKALSGDGMTVLRASSRWTVAGGDMPLGIPDSNAALTLSFDASVIAGVTNDGTTYSWTSGTTTVLPVLGVGGSCIPADMSSDGSVIVGTQNHHPWRWSAMTGIQDLGGLGSTNRTMAVSGDGSIVVGNSDLLTQPFPWIWSTQDGMRRLAAVLRNDYGIRLGKLTLISVEDISPDGTALIGIGDFEGARVYWVASLTTTLPVPPPITTGPKTRIITNPSVKKVTLNGRALNARVIQYRDGGRLKRTQVREGNWRFTADVRSARRPVSYRAIGPGGISPWVTSAVVVRVPGR
jgi:hypothetical protein